MNRNRLNIFRAWPIILLAMMMIVSCGKKTGSQTDGKPVVAVSFPPQARLLSEIVGDKVEIITLLPEGANAETFEPSMATMKQLAKASVWMTTNTEGFEENLKSRMASNFPGLRIEDVSGGIERIKGTHCHGGEGHHHKEIGGGDNDGSDPHLLTSLRNAQKMGANMASLMGELMPADREIFRRNMSVSAQRLQALDDSIAALFEGRQVAFMTLHPSLSYFAADYGLEQIPLEKDGKEPSPAELARRFDEAASHGAKVIVLDREHPSEGTATLARKQGFDVVELGLNSGEWQQSLRRLATVLNAK